MLARERYAQRITQGRFSVAPIDWPSDDDRASWCDDASVNHGRASGADASGAIDATGANDGVSRRYLRDEHEDQGAGYDERSLHLKIPLFAVQEL
jgi:hypothetical protein